MHTGFIVTRYVTRDLNVPGFPKSPNKLLGFSGFKGHCVALTVLHVRRLFHHFSVLALLFGIADRELVLQLPPRQ